MGSDPRIFILNRKSREVPLAAEEARGGEPATFEAIAIEVAPGVRVACLGWGDNVVPCLRQRTWEVVTGAKIAVWAGTELAESDRFQVEEARHMIETFGATDRARDDIWSTERNLWDHARNLLAVLDKIAPKETS